MAARKKTPAQDEEPKQQQEQQEQKVYTEDEVKQLLAAMSAEISALKQQISAAPKAAPAPAKEKVMFRWQAPVSQDNVLEIGPGGRWATITGPEQTFSVPKDEIGNILTAQVRNLLDMRWLIVLSGLDEDELEAIGCNYKPGEVLTRQAFSRLIEMGEGIVPIYKDLCAGSRKIVAQFYYEAWASGKPGVYRDVVTALKELDPDEAAFKEIIREMNERDAK